MHDTPSAVLLCPGRGSYGKEELSVLARTLRPGAIADALDAADAARRDGGRPTVRELDGAREFRPSLHLESSNASELIYFATVADGDAAAERYRVVGVAGSSLGWYSALAVAGALTPHEGWRLVATMSALQRDIAGGQLLTTTVDDEWHRDAAHAAAVDRALDEVNAMGDGHFAAWSIRLGGHAVLAGTEAAISELLRRLPTIRVGKRDFPFRLAGHGPFHTRLCAPVAERAARELSDLALHPPRVHLIDGFGRMHSPWSCDPAALRRYTLGGQVTETFDFRAAVTVAMRELQPDVLVCLGPGTSLRAPVGHCVVAERWRGVDGRLSLVASELVR